MTSLGTTLRTSGIVTLTFGRTSSGSPRSWRRGTEKSVPTKRIRIDSRKALAHEHGRMGRHLEMRLLWTACKTRRRLASARENETNSPGKKPLWIRLLCARNASISEHGNSQTVVQPQGGRRNTLVG